MSRTPVILAALAVPVVVAGRTRAGGLTFNDNGDIQSRPKTSMNKKRKMY